MDDITDELKGVFRSRKELVIAVGLFVLVACWTGWPPLNTLVFGSSEVSLRWTFGAVMNVFVVMGCLSLLLVRSVVLQKVGWRWPGAIGHTVGWRFGLCVLCVVVGILVKHGQILAENARGCKPVTPVSDVVVVLATTTGPIVEEVVFRGVLMLLLFFVVEWLKARLEAKGVVSATFAMLLKMVILLWQAYLFGSAHQNYDGCRQGVVMLAGLALGAVAWWTRSCFGSAVAHSTINVLMGWGLLSRVFWHVIGGVRNCLLFTFSG